jgi:hypothetical protein
LVEGGGNHVEFGPWPSLLNYLGFGAGGREGGRDHNHSCCICILYPVWSFGVWTFVTQIHPNISPFFSFWSFLFTHYDTFLDQFLASLFFLSTSINVFLSFFFYITEKKRINVKKKFLFLCFQVKTQLFNHFFDDRNMNQ